MQQRITIDDIGRLAGVSRTTVSRVLNHKPDVDPATRERVLRVITEQGFVPSNVASGLAGGRSRLIGMLIPAFTWPNIPDLIRGIAEVINHTPFEMVLYSYNDEDTSRDRTEVINRILATHLTAGVLAIFPGKASEQLTQLYHQGLPVVIIDDQQEQTVPWISVDNVTGAMLAVRHLVSLGHRRIAHIKGPEEYLVSQQRYAGYCLGLEEASIPLDAALVLPGDFSPPSGRSGAMHLLALPPEQRPTAIFAAADQTAYGVMAAVEALGLSIPEDLALVGFDDDPLSAYLHPPLTTIHQPSYEMGQSGIELLLKMLAAAEAARNGIPMSALKDVESHTILPTSLVVRVSCGAGLHIPLPSR